MSSLQFLAKRAKVTERHLEILLILLSEAYDVPIQDLENSLSFRKGEELREKIRSTTAHMGPITVKNDFFQVMEEDYVEPVIDVYRSDLTEGAKIVSFHLQTGVDNEILSFIMKAYTPKKSHLRLV